MKTKAVRLYNENDLRLEPTAELVLLWVFLVFADKQESEELWRKLYGNL